MSASLFDRALPARRVLPARWLTVTAAVLCACATHRGDPPRCQGPFTPINPAAAVVSNDPQH